jgi:predicted DNA-binding WGR domain protein
MPRYENTEDGASKFWEVEVEGSTLTTRYGRIGAKGSSTTKTFPSDAAAEAAANKLVAEKTAKGYALSGATPAPPAEAAPAAAAPAKKASSRARRADAAPALPDFDGIEAKKLLAATAKVHKKPEADHWKVADFLFGTTGVAYDRRTELAWHLIRHGALTPERHFGALEMLSDDLGPAPDPVEVAELCTRLPARFEPLLKKGYGFSALLDEFPVVLDRLLFQAFTRDRAAFESRKERMPPNLRLALALFQGRMGEAVDPAVAAEIQDQLARGQANGYGICSNYDIPMVIDGVVKEHRVGDTAALTRLAERFGGREAWIDALLRHAKTGNWSFVRYVHPALVRADVDALAAMLGSRSSFHDSAELQTIFDLIMKERRDDPAVLLDAAVRMTAEESHAEEVREVLLVCAARRFQELGREVPLAFDEALQFCFFPAYGYKVMNGFTLHALRALPRERVLPMAERLLAEEIGFHRAAGPLAAHFDQAVLERLLRRHDERGYTPHEIIAECGAPALPTLIERLASAKKDAKRTWHRIVLQCFAAMGDAGQTLAPEHEALIHFDREGDDLLDYGDSERDARYPRVLRAVPEERRLPLLLDRIRTEKLPYRAMMFLGQDAPTSAWDEAARALIQGRSAVDSSAISRVHERGGEPFVAALERHMPLTGGDANFLGTLRSALPHLVYQRLEAALGGAKETERDALLRLAREAEGADKIRVYVLERLWEGNEKGFAARPGSLTVSGGRAPGLDDAAIPLDRSDEPLTHLFTLDFADMPELAAHWPGARAVAFFCPEPDRGERYGETVWVPIPQGATIGEIDGEPIAVVPLDVPCSVFDRSDSAHPALRKMIFNADGHVLGEPIWIQDEEADSGAWVMQVNEGLSEANTGDSGSLYLYTGGTTFQCY